MDDWLNIAVELSILCFFGFLYYIFQKKRIIRLDTHEVFIIVDELVYELNQYLDGREKENEYTELNQLTIELEEIFKEASIEKLKNLMSKDQPKLPQAINNKIIDLKKRLDFYIV
jgi:hypothetical protein